MMNSKVIFAQDTAAAPASVHLRNDWLLSEQQEESEYVHLILVISPTLNRKDGLHQTRRP